MLRRKCATDRRLLLVIIAAGEDEVIVRNRRLARADRVSAGDLVEGVDGEWCRAVGGRQQVRIDAERRPGGDRRVLVDAVRPEDLLRHRHRACTRGIGPVDRGRLLDGTAKLPTSGGEDAAAPADFVLLRRERQRHVVLALRQVAEAPGLGLEFQFVAVARIGDRLGALQDVQPEVEGIPAEDVAHVVAAHDHQLEADLLRDGLQPGGAHLPRRSNRKAIPGDEEGLAAVHSRAEVGHEVAKRAGLPAFVQRLEALRHAVGGGGDLVRVDGVELPAELRARQLRIPEDQRTAAHHETRSGSRRALPAGMRGRSSTLMPGFRRAGMILCISSCSSLSARGPLKP